MNESCLRRSGSTGPLERSYFQNRVATETGHGCDNQKSKPQKNVRSFICVRPLIKKWCCIIQINNDILHSTFRNHCERESKKKKKAEIYQYFCTELSITIQYLWHSSIWSFKMYIFLYSKKLEITRNLEISLSALYFMNVLCTSSCFVMKICYIHFK